MKRRNEMFIGMVAVTFLILCLAVWLKPQKEYSFAERRKLSQFPAITVENFFSGRFMEAFENYALDQFPMRDRFRTLKALTSLKLDNHEIYMVEGYLNSMEYPMNRESLLYASKKFQEIYHKYLKESNCKVYFSVIPDKNYFFAEEYGYLSMDYEELFFVMQEENSNMTYIDIFDELSKESYYKTDTHWKQEALIPVAKKISAAMEAEFEGKYDINQVETPFYGVLYGQAALPAESDNISYLTNKVIQEYNVFDRENNKEIPVYDLQKTESKDPYEMFLGGSLSLITIYNKNSTNQKQLIIFRDSFGSSIAPLLAEGYSKTTLIDIRYLQSSFLEKFVEFEEADVLFLYSTSVLNHSETLK